jgi:hypothetical protein
MKGSVPSVPYFRRPLFYVPYFTGQVSGKGSVTGDYTIGLKTTTFGGSAGPESFGIGGEEGEGALGGGSISITKEGLNELKEAWQEVRDDVGLVVEKVLTDPITH